MWHGPKKEVSFFHFCIMLEGVQFFIVVKYTNMYNKINVFNHFKYTVQCC